MHVMSKHLPYLMSSVFVPNIDNYISQVSLKYLYLFFKDWRKSYD